MKKLTIIIPEIFENLNITLSELNGNPLVEKIIIVQKESNEYSEQFENILCENQLSYDALLQINNMIKEEKITSEYILFISSKSFKEFNYFALERFLSVALDTGSKFVYSNYLEENSEGNPIKHPVIDYQKGSLRDDFNFGSVFLIESNLFRNSFNEIKKKYKFAGFYAFRLYASSLTEIFRIPEYLYTLINLDNRKSGEKLFDYVNPANREVQIEMEEACTEYLKHINAYLTPEFKKADFSHFSFEYKASVVIPVKNREKTIADAIESVITQNTDFPFNLIIVDNHSTDRTTEIISEFAEKDERIIHIIPERKDLEIGGCWNLAVHHEKAGMFVIQLDSDDIYINQNTVATIIDKFYQNNYAMVVGSYKLTDFNLNELPPGIIDHKEWTDDNGRNNALRINGLGAPRAFFTPILREIKIPNVSYGEDYALGLAISREYQIGRIYEPLYVCRRWSGNSDSELDVKKLNDNNLYKDRIRTIELLSRIQFNRVKYVS